MISVDAFWRQHNYIWQRFLLNTWHNIDSSGPTFWARIRLYTWTTRAQLLLGLADRAHSQPASIAVRVWCFEHVACAGNVNVVTYLHNFRYKLNVRYLVEILALQSAAKQLQLATWLSILTAAIGTYQRPIQRHHRRPYTTYRLATIQNCTDRQTDDRRTQHRTIARPYYPVRSAKNDIFCSYIYYPRCWPL